jgi:hypothetical protein
MRLITQPNGWTCAAACVCMLTDTSLEEFYSFCGHDGSEMGQVTEMRPIGRRCFSTKELMGYLLKHNLMMGWGCTPAKGFNPKANRIEFIDFGNQPALIDVQSATPGLIHCIVWNTRRIIDPYFPERQVELSDYELLAWWPITRIHDEEWITLK